MQSWDSRRLRATPRDRKTFKKKQKRNVIKKHQTNWWSYVVHRMANDEIRMEWDDYYYCYYNKWYHRQRLGFIRQDTPLASHIAMMEESVLKKLIISYLHAFCLFFDKKKNSRISPVASCTYRRKWVKYLIGDSNSTVLKFIHSRFTVACVVVCSCGQSSSLHYYYYFFYSTIKNAVHLFLVSSEPKQPHTNTHTHKK